MSPVVFVAVSTTIAWLFAVALVWLIEHDCVMPVVRTHLATFVESADWVAWTTAQLGVEQRKTFFPPADATWTTGCRVEVHLQPLPGQCGPA